MADIRCPMCGTNNPEGNTNCEKCGARLVPMGSIGESRSNDQLSQSGMLDPTDLSSLLDDIVDEGASANTGEMDSEILNWLDEDQPERKGEPQEESPAVEDRLSNLLDDIEPPVDEQSINNWLETSPVEEEGVDSADVDWLEIADDDLGETQQQTLEELLPDWSEAADSDSVEVVSSPVEPAEPMDVPDWMSETVTDASSLLEEVTSDDEENDLPDWMSDTVMDTTSFVEESTQPTPDSEDQQIPDWLQDAPRATTGELDGKVLEDAEEMPGWFSEGTDVPDPELVGDDEEQPVPDWLKDAPRPTTGELDTSVLKDADEMPGWFTKGLDEDAVEEQKETPSTGSLDERVSTGALPWVAGVSDAEEELPTFESVVDEPIEKPSTGSLDERVSTGALPWVAGVSDDEEETPTFEPPAAEPKKQVFETEGLDTSSVEEPARDSLKPDDKLPASSGILDGQHVSTGSLPWMDGVSDPADEPGLDEAEEDFDLPGSKKLDETKVDQKRSSSLLKKVTTSMLPWMAGVSDDEDKPKDPEAPTQSTTILERFSGLLNRSRVSQSAAEKPVVPEPEVEEPVNKEPEDSEPEEKTPEVQLPSFMEEPTQPTPEESGTQPPEFVEEATRAVESLEETSKDETSLEAILEAPEDTLADEEVLEEASLEIEGAIDLSEGKVETNFEFVEPVIEEEDDVPLPEPHIPTLNTAILDESPELEDEDMSMSVDDLVKEEDIQTIAPPPKENYADALPEEEEKADTWDDFLDSDEFSPDKEELPEWFSQTTTEKSASDMLKTIGADENPTPVPVEEPEEEEPKKKRGLTLGFLKGIRRRTDKKLEAKALEEAEAKAAEAKQQDEEEKATVTKGEETSFDDAMGAINEDWDLAEVLTESKPLDETVEEDDDFSDEIAREDWVIEEADEVEEDESDDQEAFIESLEEPEGEAVEESQSKELAEEKKNILQKTAGLAGDTGTLEQQDLEPEDEALIGFAGTSELPTWMVGSAKKSQGTTDLLNAALGVEGEEEDAEQEKPEDEVVSSAVEIEEPVVIDTEAAAVEAVEAELITPESEETEEVEPDDQQPEVEEEPTMTAGLPEWMNTGKLPEPEEVPFDVDDELMESIDGAVPTTELPEWLADAEDQVAVEKEQEPAAEEKQEIPETSEDVSEKNVEADDTAASTEEEQGLEEIESLFEEPAVEEPEIFTGMFSAESIDAAIGGPVSKIEEKDPDEVGFTAYFEQIESGEDGEEASLEDLVDSFFAEGDEGQPESISDEEPQEPAEEEKSREEISDALMEAGLPEWLDDNVASPAEESLEESLDEALAAGPALDIPSISQHLPKFMDDDMDFVTDEEPGESKDEAEEEILATASLPDWMNTAEDEPVVEEPVAEEQLISEPEQEESMEVEAVVIESEELPEDIEEIEELLEAIEVSEEEDSAEIDDEAAAAFIAELESDAEEETVEPEPELEMELPEWMDELAEDEESEEIADEIEAIQPETIEEEPAKPGTAALEEWMADPTATHGMTGMLLDGLETGTLPPLEDEPEAEVPDWMTDLPSEMIDHEQASAEEADSAAALPDWMEALPEEDSVEPDVEKEEPVKPGTAALEEWMADPTATHGMTGMLLDGLETGTLPPLEEEPVAEVPDWMADLPEEESSILDESESEDLTDASEIDLDAMFGEESTTEVGGTATLPDWMNELTDDTAATTVVSESEEEAVGEEKPGTTALEEWMADPTATRGLTGMLLDGLESGTLPPMEDFVDESESSEEELAADLPDWMDNPEASRGKTGALLDSLETAALPSLDEFDQEDLAEEEELPDWLSEMDIQPVEEDEITPAASTTPLDDVAATMPLEDLAATHALPDWMSAASVEGEDESEEAEDIPVDLADFVSGGDELPDWVDDVAGEAPVEEADEEPFESAFDTAPETMSQDATRVLPKWVNDMESVHGHTGMLIDNLNTEETQALDSENLPDWLSEYGEEESQMGEPATASQMDVDAWLVDQTSPEEEPEDDSLEPDIKTDTGELNQWISEQGISAEEAAEGEVEIGDVLPIEAQTDLPDWILDLEPDETAPVSPEMVQRKGTAALPEWVVGDEEPDIDMTEEVPPMDSGLFDFLAEEKPADSEELASDSLFQDDVEMPAMFDKDQTDKTIAASSKATEDFDIASFEEEKDSGDSLFGEPDEEEGEEVTPEDLFSATAPSDFSADDDLSQGEEVSPFDISQLEEVEENYTPAMELADQSQWLGEYAEEEEQELFEEPPAIVNPFNITLDEAEEAEAEGIEVAEELPDWVDEIEAADSAEDLWETPIAAMAAISSSVQTSFDEEQPEIDRERAHIQLMERILLSEKGTVAVSRPRRRTRELTLRLMLTLLVAVAVFAGLYTMVPPRSDFVTNAPAAVVKFDQAVDYFQANLSDQPVLVVFDYQPAYHEEISVYAELPLKTLMEKDARIFTFSTVPEGPALGQKMLFDVVIRNGLQYNTTSQAVPLGYLPGGSNAIRDFSLQMRSTMHGLDVGSSGMYIWDLPQVTDVDSIDDFALVLVLSDDLDKSRLWIEQSTLYLPETTPMLMVTSARISPMLRPYLLSEQLDGLIGSAVDAAAYGNPELSNQVGNYIYYWRAYQLGIYLMVATIIAGALLQIMRQLQRTFKRGKS